MKASQLSYCRMAEMSGPEEPEQSGEVEPTLEFANKTRLRNFCVIVEQQNLWISREALAERSPVFRAMFFGDFAETQQNEVELRDKTIKEMVPFLQQLHATAFDPPTQFSWANILSTYQLAREYQVDKLQDWCLSCLDYEIPRLDPQDVKIC